MAITMTGNVGCERQGWLKDIGEWDSMALAGLCLADMASTLYWVHSGAARESNPLLAACLQHGDFAFCAQKLVSFLPLLLFCAYYRARRPRLIALALRGTVACYVLFYIIAVFMATFC